MEDRKDKLTSDELCSLEAYRLRVFYAVPEGEPLLEELIEYDGRGWMREAVARLEIVRTPHARLREADQNELTQTDKHPEQCRSREMQAGLCRDLLRCLKFDPFTMQAQGYRWDGLRLTESGLVDYVVEHILDIETFLKLKVPGNIQDNPVRFVNDFLRSLGLKTRSQQLRADGVRRRFYRIDEHQLARMRRIIADRVFASVKDPIKDAHWLVYDGLFFTIEPFKPAAGGSGEGVTPNDVVFIKEVV
jgi:hypothetical protein